MWSTTEQEEVTWRKETLLPTSQFVYCPVPALLPTIIVTVYYRQNQSTYLVTVPSFIATCNLQWYFLRAASLHLTFHSGSFTWPPFRGAVPVLNKMYSDFKDVANFVVCYIEEAHAQDEWPIGSVLKYNQPKTLDERCQIASDFVKVFTVCSGRWGRKSSFCLQATGCQLPIVVDYLDNAFESTYSQCSSCLLPFTGQNDDNSRTQIHWMELSEIACSITYIYLLLLFFQQSNLLILKTMCLVLLDWLSCLVRNRQKRAQIDALYCDWSKQFRQSKAWNSPVAECHWSNQPKMQKKLFQW